MSILCNKQSKIIIPYFFVALYNLVVQKNRGFYYEKDAFNMYGTRRSYLAMDLG